MAYPTPVPTPTGEPDTNKSWNQLWNEGWNAGFNTPSGPPSSGGAYGTGFSIGQQEFWKRNPQTSTTTQNNVSKGGTGGSSGGSVSGSLMDQQQGIMQEQPQQSQIDFDALIAPAIQGLEAAIGPLQQGALDTQTGIQSSLTNQKAANQANITGQENVLGQARTTQETTAENAVNEARRQYSEIQQGLQSRYGGTTGTGAFASELAGRQTQQNIGKVRQQLSSAMLEIDNKLQQVQEVGRIALQDLEDKASDQIRQSKNQLDMQLAEIRRQKGEIQANKATLAANAIQLFQTTVNNVNAQNAQFKQNLYLQQQAAEQNLKLAQQKAQGISESYQQDSFSNIGQQVTPVGNVVTQYPAQGTTDTSGQLYSNNALTDLLRKNQSQIGTYSGGF